MLTSMKLPRFLSRRGLAIVALLVLAFASSAQAEGGSKDSSRNLRSGWKNESSLVSSYRRSLVGECTEDWKDFVGLNNLLVGISDNSKSWLETDTEAPVGFVLEMVNLFAEESIQSDTGLNIRGPGGGYPDVCNRLPLIDETCYFVTNPDKSFLELLVAKYVPFGDKIVEAKQSVEDFVGSITEPLDDIKDFFLQDAEDVGQCWVINDAMLGIADNPGFPPPWIYQFCNCFSMKTNGVPACTVQAYFKGFAMSLEGSDALKFDIEDRLGTEQKFFDGFAEQTYTPYGDIWASMDLDIKIPKITGVSDLVCTPPPGGAAGKPTAPALSGISFKTSLFIKNNLDEVADSELLVLIAVEEVSLKVLKFIDLSLGSAFLALRVRSANPDCQPSGLYGQVEIGNDFGLSDGMRIFLDGFLPSTNAVAKFGVTWLDTGDVVIEDFLQSIFLSVKVKEFNFMGWTAESADIEIQYIDDKEFKRRREYDPEKCCALEGLSDCAVVASPLTDWIQDETIDVQTTVAMFLKIQDMKFLGGVVNFSLIEMQFLFQVGDSEKFALKFLLAVKVKVLFILGIDAFCVFELRNGGKDWYAEFSAMITINAGIGTAVMTLKGTAAVGDFTYDPLDRALSGRQVRRALHANENDRALSSHSILDADFSLVVDADWQTAKWLEDLGAALLGALDDIYKGLEVAWNAVGEFASKVFEEIKELAKVIGGAILSLLNVVDDVLDVLSVSLDAVVGFLDNGTAIGTVSAAVLGAIAEPIIASARLVVNVGIAIFSGDWKAVEDAFNEFGEALADTFGFSKSVGSKTPVELNENDALWNCPLLVYTWEECSRAFGIKYDCNTKTGAPFPERECAEMKAKMASELAEMANLAKAQEDCRIGSVDRSQGLMWASESATASDLGATMKNEQYTIGQSSVISEKQVCNKLPFSVGVNTLSTDTQSTSGITSTDVTSDACVNFTTEQDLTNTLSTFANEVTVVITDLSRGDQGLDKDTTVQKCNKVAGGECSTPTISEGMNFQASATVTCDIDFQKFTWKSVFGEANLSVDPSCPVTSPVFNIKNTFDPSSDGCAPVTMTIERYGVDCCREKTETLIQTLTIETLPPTFTSMPGSLDMELDCTSNIYPRELGYPLYDAGCPGATQELSSEDSAPEFDLKTCETTIERTFTVTDDGCNEKSQAFVQVITLKNDHDPEWDVFPPDVTIGVFDPYGTDTTGFPTVYQPCGASPVYVTYTDEIGPGECFAERILTRTFTAVDACDHASVRSQHITIVNDSNDLPLGTKSLSKIYGRNNTRIGNDDSKCLFSAEECGVTGAPNDYVCGSAPEDEFFAYQDFLSGLDDERSLDLGPTQTTCTCPENNVFCDESQSVNDRQVLFGVQVVFSSGKCTVLESQPSGLNSGTTEPVNVGCPAALRGNKKAKINLFERTDCVKTVLKGLNPVYNMFSIGFKDLQDSKFEIDAPATSIVLINVMSEVGDSIRIEKLSAQGVTLVGVGASHVLWNVLNGGDMFLSASSRVPFEFYGTMLNPLATMNLVVSQLAESKWVGQLFCDTLNANKIDFECGHFAGFASCSPGQIELV